MSKVRTVSVRKDDTRKMEDEARKMEAKLEMLRRTMDVAAAESGKGGSGGDSGSRWRSGSTAKPLNKGYVKGVLETKPKRTGSQQRAPSNGRSEDPAREGGGSAVGSGRTTPRQQPAQQGKVGEILGPLQVHQDRSPPATVSASSRAAANLQAAMQQQSGDGIEVEAFLASLKLDRYVSLFMEHGFDCMDVVQDMQESHMKDIGMAPGHILKLRKKLGEMAPAAPPPPAPSAPEKGAEASKAATSRQVSFGGTEEVRVKAAEGTGTGTSGALMDGGFNEEESAASFQEALRAWREGRPASGGPAAARAAAGGGGPASAPKAAPGSFWQGMGDSEMDLVRCSTPVKPPTDAALAEAEVQRAPDAGEEKLCCYQCFKQFYAKYAVERESDLPDTGGNKVKKLCSEACAERWVAAMEAKAEALRKRHEKLEKMQEMHRALEAERLSTPPSAAAPLDGAAERTLIPPEASMAQVVA